ncbi:MAG: sigma-54 dependent transcriptional regulator [archaeon]
MNGARLNYDYKGPDSWRKRGYKKTLNIAEKYASRSNSEVLIIGEAGSGKELIARYIHELARDGKPFVAAHMGGIPEGLFESHLFGHKRGAFTHAIENVTGYTEMANGGTLFLDEIGTMPYGVQQKLLRVLEAKEYRVVGDPKLRELNARVISATNADLLKRVEQGEFREDLYDRLAKLVVRVPSLDERREDIPLLVNYFLEFSPLKTRVRMPNRELGRRLQEHEYRGNVRELKNMLEGMVILAEAEEDCLTEKHLELYLESRELKKRSNPNEGNSIVKIPEGYVDGKTFNEARGPLVDEIEKAIIIAALRKTGGIVVRAAKNLNTDRANLTRKISSLGLRGHTRTRRQSQ